MAVTDKTPMVVIAGAGLMGRWHANYIRRSGANLVAVFDKDPSRARELISESKSTASIAVSYEDMLARFKPDIVHICTPLDTHFEMAMCALQAGTHVVVEKPLTDTAAHASELIEVARKNRLQLCPVHQMGFQHGVRDIGPRVLEDFCSGLHIRTRIIVLEFTHGNRNEDGDKKALVRL